MPSSEQILDVLTGRMTASDVADRLGLPSPAEVVPVLNRLHGEGRIDRIVSGDDLPVVRWAVAVAS